MPASYLTQDEESDFGAQLLGISGNIQSLLNACRAAPFAYPLLMDVGIQVAKALQLMPRLILPPEHPLADIAFQAHKQLRQAIYEAGLKAERSLQAYKRQYKAVLQLPCDTLRFYLSLIGIVNANLHEMDHIFRNRGAREEGVALYRNRDIMEFIFILADIISYIHPHQFEGLHGALHPWMLPLRPKSSVDLRYNRLFSFYDFVHLAEASSGVPYWSSIPDSDHRRILAGYRVEDWGEAFRRKMGDP